MLLVYLKRKLFNQGKLDKVVSGIATTCKKFGDKYAEEPIKSFKDIPGPKSYPIIGTLHKYLPYIGDYDVEALDKNAWLNWRRYGSLVREAPGVRVLHVYDPEDIETVFRQDHRYPARRSHVAMFHYRTNKPQVYNTGGLLSTNGPEWWRLRSTFQKNFTSPQSVRSHIENTDEVVIEFLQWIKEKKVSHNEDFLPYLNRLNLEGIISLALKYLLYSFMPVFPKGSADMLLVIGTVAFNERFKSFSAKEQDPDSRSSKTIEAAFWSNCGIMKLDKGFLWKLFKTPLYNKLAKSQEYLEKVSTEILLKRANFFERDTYDDSSLIASFLKQPNLDMKDITGMMVDILMAAIDTTAYATSFALYHISRNPEVQEKMFSEIITILPKKDSKITSEVLSQAVYVRSCIKESLRLNPVSVGVGRVSQKDFILKGHHIPTGTVIVTQNLVASRLPQYVRDPEKFCPERWLRGSDSYESIHPFLSLPFGFGPRSCIARRLAEQNICIVLIRLLRDFEIKWMGRELGIRTLLINKPNQPVSLSFTSRSV